MTILIAELYPGGNVVKQLLAIALVLATANVLYADDDDDDGVGLRVTGDFELSQGLVFGHNDGVRVYRSGNLRVTGGQVRGGTLETRLGDGIDADDHASVSIIDSDIAATDDAIKAKAYSTVSISGGTLVGEDDGVAAVGDSMISISGGNISGGVNGLLGSDLARFQVSGGMITGPVGLNGESSLRLSGGGIDGDVRLFDRATLNVLGGSISGIIEAGGSAHVNFFVDEVGNLLDGSPIERRVFETRLNEDVRRTFFTTVTENQTIDQTGFGNIGVISNSVEPTEITVERFNQGAIYLLDHSEASIRRGLINHGVTADDTSRLFISGGEFGQNQREGILAKRNSTVEITGGAFSGYTHGIQLQGRSTTSISSGTVKGHNRDGLHLLNHARVNISGGEISGVDEGIRASHNSSIVISGGSVSGDSNGVSISESATLVMRDGHIDGVEHGLRMRDDTEVTISGGRINNRLMAENSSRLQVSGGEINGDVIGRKSAGITVRGGMISDDIRLSDETTMALSGGSIRGDVTTRDSAAALISGGTVGGNVVAEDNSKIRIVGRDLEIRDDRLVGKLMDGSRIRGTVLRKDKGSIELFEGLDGHEPISSPQPAKNFAILDGTVVDFLPGAHMPGEVTMFEGSRVNLFGGTFSNPIKTEDEAIRSIYGSDYQTTYEHHDDGTVSMMTVTGVGIDGSPFEYSFVDDPFAFFNHRLYEVVNETVTLPNRRAYSYLAVLDGAAGPSTVTSSPSTYLSTVDVRQNSTFQSESNIQGSFETVAVWDNAAFHMTGGSLFSYSAEAIAVHDHGTATVAGGMLTGTRDGIRLRDQAHLAFSNGTLDATNDGIDVSNRASVVVSGGNINGGDDALKAKDESQVIITGGHLVGADDGVSLTGNTRTSILGGQTEITGGVNGLLAISNAYAEVHDGQFSGGASSIRSRESSVVHIFGGEFENRLVADGGKLLIVGSNLSISDSGAVTGELLDQSRIEWQTETHAQGTVEILNTSVGDSNLDGEFNSKDLVEIFAANEYEDDAPLNSTWSEGDWNGDGDFNTSDLVYAFNVGGYERRSVPAGASVPEPNGLSYVAIATFAAVFASKRRRRLALK